MGTTSTICYNLMLINVFAHSGQIIINLRS